MVKGRAVCILWPQEWSTKRFLSWLPTVDYPHRRATDREFIEWIKQNKERELREKTKWCELQWSAWKELEIQERRDKEQRKLDNGGKKWEQFINELKVRHMTPKS